MSFLYDEPKKAEPAKLKRRGYYEDFVPDSDPMPSPKDVAEGKELFREACFGTGEVGKARYEASLKRFRER